MKDIEKAAALLRSVKSDSQLSVNSEKSALPQTEPKSVTGNQEQSSIVSDIQSANQSSNAEINRSDPVSRSAPDEYSNDTSSSVLLNQESEIADESSIDLVPYYKHLKIPLERLEKAGHITPNVEKNKLTEEYRRIKRPLIRNLSHSDIPQHTNVNVLMVTSAVSGEGKTYTSINLAMSLAQERERRVVFVDADVLKGTAGDVLGASRNVPGLIDVLSGTVSSVQKVVQQTNVPNLWFVPAGKPSSHANELLASERMERCIQEMSNLFGDCILVFDCPPILLTNEANILLHHAGQIVFVVAERQTSQKFVNEALAQIDENTYLGLILNRSRKRHAVYSYGYG